MSIRSVDMMMLYSRNSDVERVQQTEQQQGRLAQQQLNVQEIKAQEIKRAQVQKTEQDEADRIKDHPERKRGKHLNQDAEDTEEQDDQQQASQKQALYKEPHSKGKKSDPLKPTIDIRV